MSPQDHVWIFDSLQNFIIITRDVVMILHDVQPSLVSKSNGNTTLGNYDIHRAEILE